MFAAKEAIFHVWAYYGYGNRPEARERMQELINYIQSLLDGIH